MTHEIGSSSNDDSVRLRASAGSLCAAILDHCEQLLSVKQPANLNSVDEFESTLLRAFQEHSLLQEEIIGTAMPYGALGDLYEPDGNLSTGSEGEDDSIRDHRDGDDVIAVTLLVRSDFNVNDRDGLIELAQDVDSTGCFDPDRLHVGMALHVLEQEFGARHLRGLPQLTPCGATSRVISTPLHSGDQDWQLDENPFRLDGHLLFQADEVD